MDNCTRRDKGMAYITDEKVFSQLRERRKIVQEFNQTDCCDTETLKHLTEKLLGKCGKNCCLTQPFYCDYGKNIFVGDNFYTNYNCIIRLPRKLKLSFKIDDATNQI